MAEPATRITSRFKRLWPSRSVQAPTYAPSLDVTFEPSTFRALTAGELIAMARNARIGRTAT